jgi:hypothetical protein
MCQRVQSYLDAGARELTCEVTGRIDLSLVDALARLRLITRRHDARLHIKADGCRDELGALLSYLGLESLTDWSEPGGQAEAGE